MNLFTLQNVFSFFAIVVSAISLLFAILGYRESKHTKIANKKSELSLLLVEIRLMWQEFYETSKFIKRTLASELPDEKISYLESIAGIQHKIEDEHVWINTNENSMTLPQLEKRIGRIKEVKAMVQNRYDAWQREEANREQAQQKTPADGNSAREDSK